MAKLSVATGAAIAAILLAISSLVVVAYLLGRSHAAVDRKVAETVAESELAQRLADMQTALVEGCQARLTQFYTGETVDEEALRSRGDGWSRILGIESTMSAMTSAHMDMRQSCTEALGRIEDLAAISEDIKGLRESNMGQVTALGDIQSHLTQDDDPSVTIANVIAGIHQDVGKIEEVLSNKPPDGSSPLAQLWATLRDVDASLKTRTARLDEMTGQLNVMQKQLAHTTLKLEAFDITSQDGSITVTARLPQGLNHKCKNLSLYLLGEWKDGKAPGIGIYPLLRLGHLKEDTDARTCFAHPDMDMLTADESGVDLTIVTGIVTGGPGFAPEVTEIREVPR